MSKGISKLSQSVLFMFYTTPSFFFWNRGCTKNTKTTYDCSWLNDKMYLEKKGLKWWCNTMIEVVQYIPFPLLSVAGSHYLLYSFSWYLWYMARWFCDIDATCRIFTFSANHIASFPLPFRNKWLLFSQHLFVLKGHRSLCRSLFPWTHIL